MKHNYGFYLLLIIVIIFRQSILNVFTNVNRHFFLKDTTTELSILKNENAYLNQQYNLLTDFKEDISIESDYIITNVLKTSYGFNNLLINGTDYEIGSEVVTQNGLVGVVKKVNTKNTEVTYIYNSSIVVKVNEDAGKITGHDAENNLIVKEISNYNNIKINDLVYSVHGNLIGKVIKIKYDTLDHYLTVKTIPLSNLSYVAVISRS